MPQLSIIIVNYNVKYFLEECLQSVRRAIKNIDAEIFVVDNNSVDGSVEWLKEKFTDVTLIANTENVGFSKANNQAIKIAKGEFILLLNPDTVVQEDTFEKCIQFMQHHANAGALGVKMVDGTGKFLPESKRGFPSPSAAIFKMSGLSKLFSHSKKFNQYHAGHLAIDTTNEVEVLAGAFMFIRKTTLDKAGLLDETFFMYGEDIDLSWRIIEAGYKNYYFPETQIIHYKGESTKKATFNYVKHFYQAMIIFAKKHYSKNATWLILFLQIAIYVKGFAAYFKNLFGKMLLPLADAIVIFWGLYFIKSFWEKNIITADNFKYPSTFTYVVIPCYTLIWLICSYFAGAYDKPLKFKRVVRGVLIGSVFISSVYAFLPDWIRFSRAIILLGSAFSLASMISIRQLLKWASSQNNNANEDRKIIAIGKKDEAYRVQKMITKLGVNHEWVGIIHPDSSKHESEYLSAIFNLKEVVNLFKVNEIIFCARDISAQQIIYWMTNIQSQVSFKIVGEAGMSIVGSNSKDTSGDLYAMDFSFSISTPFGKRNKMLIDYFISIGFIITLPFWLFIASKKTKIWNGILPVLFRKKTWMGYQKNIAQENIQLPHLLPAVFTLADAIPKTFDESTLQHLRFVYAKNYTVFEDISLLWKCITK
ncbi:MAG: hypothetical protein RL708_173 [Bacteroidota bacterium]|jgi:GT2 family glycosyltransferase